MLDLKSIRENPEKFKNSLKTKGVEKGIDELLEVDEARRKKITEMDALKNLLNKTSRQIGILLQEGKEAEAHRLKEEMKKVSDEIDRKEEEVQSLEKELQSLLLNLPNLSHPSVPVGKDESENVVREYHGEPRKFETPPRPHWELGEALGIIDFERGAKISGTRFYVLRGQGARLERCLIQFMLDVHTKEHGYVEIFPPFLIRRECMVGTGQLPKFEEDMYRIDRDDLFLDPTAEVPVTNLHRGEILSAEELPIRYVAYSACFRREAGAAGKDVRGIIRVHQFNKVELVKFTTPETSYEELEKLKRDAASILEKLGLAYRVVEMCTGDLGFAAAKKYDLDVWMPGQNRYVEVSSISNFEAFQARRANIRYREHPKAKPKYVHTLNGSGLAVGRTLAAVLENYQNADGSISIPPVLIPYFGATKVQ